ncbi:a-factor receptor [Coniosporium tulheliwenetii]|uniref:A-factor receptor n=1 Tax=Coniosporium tulheliwenetii TaxID=3383036 RepID=A0ACC2Z763_9PEZI|nr:a-factor receptor [Cladosporium sp. JES 115]
MEGAESNNGEIAVYPAAVYVPILAGIAVLLNVPPFYWHLRHRNVASSSLILWLILLNLCNVINPIIWHNDNISKWWNGKVLCDIQARLFVGATVGLTGALACIMQGLARVMDTNRAIIAPSKAQRRRQHVLDLLFCWGCPVYLMLVYYIVQPARYCIWGISGCNFVVDNSWPSIWLIFIWPPIFSLIDAYYSGLVIYRLHRHRRQFSRLLQTADTTKSRFLRLFLMTLVLVFGTLPIQFYLFALSLSVPRIPYSWTAVHADWDLVVMIPSGGTLLLDHWVRIVCGYFVFFFFGMGADATEMYRSWLVKLGFAKVFLGLDRRTSSFMGRAPLSSGGSWGSRVGKVFARKSELTATMSSSM